MIKEMNKTRKDEIADRCYLVGRDLVDGRVDNLDAKLSVNHRLAILPGIKITIN